VSVLSRERWRAVGPHLERALEMGDGERAAMLAGLRAQDPQLAADLVALLEEAAAVSRESFLEEPLTLPPRSASLAGQTIGAYTLVSQIGQGGMGGVWLARRSDGRFEGYTAVKLLNAGLVGRAGEERFRREGNFLARLTHPHIARLLDAGVSSFGQPYLVLEYVDGQQIDRYCDAQGLDVEARVRLFLDVLAAVAHAHANLIVHRDIKPTNVLVGADGRVRLLDFGIAKLLEDEAGAGEATELTREGGRALTPEYAAPEQITGGPVTTATDVYALGVLLYLLLSGRHPTGAADQSPAELVRAVVTTEPRRLSSAVAEAKTQKPETVATNAARRATTPDGLRRALKGDLETVVAKALKKHPEERYESVGAFAEDLRRYLDHEPVKARPDTLAYRGAKFLRRHIQGVAATGAAVLLLAVLTAFYTARLAGERDRASLQAEKATQISRLLTDLLTGADPWSVHKAKELTVRGLLDEGATRIESELDGQPELQAEMLTVIGRVYQRLGVLDQAQALLERGLAVARRAFGPEDEHVAETLNDLGALLDEKGSFGAAAPVLEQALRMRRKLLGPEHRDVAVTLVELGRVYSDQGLDVRAEPLLRESLAIRRKVLGEGAHETATSENELGLLLWRRGQLHEAEMLFRQALTTDRKTAGEASPDVAAALNNLALIAMEGRHFVAAEPLLRESLAIRRKALGEAHPTLIPALNNLANALREQGRYDEATSLLGEALRIGESALGDAHPLVAACDVSLARVDLARGDAAAAEPLLRRALAIDQRVYRAGDWRIAAVESVLGEALTGLRRYDEAENVLVAARGVLKDAGGREGQIAAENRTRLAALEKARGLPGK
jgi:serine/threonine protein kinase/Tfp pilus assembly protein PilF